MRLNCSDEFGARKKRRKKKQITDMFADQIVLISNVNINFSTIQRAAAAAAADSIPFAITSSLADNLICVEIDLILRIFPYWICSTKMAEYSIEYTCHSNENMNCWVLRHQKMHNFAINLLMRWCFFRNDLKVTEIAFVRRRDVCF